MLTTTPADAITAYLRAKDGNRPHLLAQAFTEDATLTMDVHTGNIVFPPVSVGREAIAEVLVRRFAQTFENVYTVCLASPPQGPTDTFRCDWLVAMTDKDSHAVRVGCGRYDWHFAAASQRADRLLITIEAMQSLPAQELDGVMHWVSRLSYPWCSPQVALQGAPDCVSPALAYLGREAIKSIHHV